VTDYKVGDKVRVTFEGLVESIDPDNEVFVEKGGLTFAFYPADIDADVEITKIAPPLKVGDVLKDSNGYVFLLLKDNGLGSFDYLDVKNQRVWADTYFTQDLYTVVNFVPEAVPA
jgi:hypothetical protein